MSSSERRRPAAADQPGTDTVGDGASVSDLLSELSTDITTLFRQEVELAKVEMKQEATVFGKASGMLVAGAVVGFVTLLLLAWAAAWGLDALVPTGLAFLIVGVVFGAAAATLGMAGKKKLDRFDPMPHATVETLQRDKQVLTERSHT